MSVDMGVRAIEEKSFSSARPVTALIINRISSKRLEIGIRERGMAYIGIPIQLGQTPLILIPSASNGFAKDRTAPTTPCLVMPYMGAMENG